MNTAWEFLWRLSIVLLPWQTRWFLDASVAGWPWEQGRLSFYVSWVVLFATIIVGWRRESAPSLRGEKKTRVLTGALFVLSLLATQGNVDAVKAVVQWWVQIAFLAAWVYTLHRAAVPRRSIATWGILALLPHAAIGALQYAVQRVDASTLLGIAAHVPETPGTSVVEHGMYRVLRVYGGFPHPNIFGGWLAVGILVAHDLAASATKKVQALFAIFASAMLSVVLLLTYSRSAWVAFACGAVALIISRVRMKRVNQFVVLSVAASLLAAMIVGVSQRDHLLARANASSRLETMSLDARRQSLRDGWTILRSHLLVGTGPNAELLTLQGETRSVRPLEPPHNVILLAMVDVGLLGVVLFVILAMHVLRSRVRAMVWGQAFVLLPCFVVGVFDHYPWSLWSGQSLVALAVLLALSGEYSS